ncbi:MAG: hypothetical protein OEW46_08225 [Actinomycetota bacterium]|nr:hypothetical protein [Actinomycetota bacterium]
MTDENRYAVELREEDEAPGWRVAIVDDAGVTVFERACHDHTEARAYASTVRQHIYWLSPERFREYYRL